MLTSGQPYISKCGAIIDVLQHDKNKDLWVGTFHSPEDHADFLKYIRNNGPAKSKALYVELSARMYYDKLGELSTWHVAEMREALSLSYNLTLITYDAALDLVDEVCGQ